MKIFTARQIRECDAFTIQEEGITSADLMERAANACASWLQQHYSNHTPVLVVCGMGNNGGDGLALTRILLQQGYPARAVVLRHAAQFSPDAAHNLTLLHQLMPENIRILEPGQYLSTLSEDILVIDALFGTGLNRPLEDWPASFVQELNALSNTVIAIDTPSGLPADSLPEPEAAVIRAQYTLSFQFYKRSFLHPEAAVHTGAVHLLDIGLSTQYITATHTQYYTTGAATAAALYKPRNPFGHKGSFGKVQLVGGSYGKMGAIALSTRAALRSGAGLVFTAAPETGNTILQVLNPEAMFIAAGKEVVEKIKAEDKAVLGIGPGMGQAPETGAALLRYIRSANGSLVLDADALNLVAAEKDMLHLLPAHTIITPHPREFERLFGKAPDSMLQVELARANAMKYNICIVLKGHHTAVVLPTGACWYNTTGNAGMATGGSGDVLTGILTALLAQGYTPADAARLGVYLHGLAGDLAAAASGQEALIAGDLPDWLGAAFRSLSGDL
ncbi:NAD(P)H-hydrate dehydratase [Taibaiella chishuiensis]|uniref:Bifunctional NAD(P)H-hydrate repair enzyme n=1 Tax=Taibaiella chishuiensis TaxID=1434707 RepID=A0A2P8CY25_9BACT|nr:NAD(P)H-hydrate dehydratase [Taibaiella chishuiensis]PSK89837.1 NAD(P)H-hydrate epimerase [Taibaiella chishuiensis]